MTKKASSEKANARRHHRGAKRAGQKTDRRKDSQRHAAGSQSAATPALPDSRNAIERYVDEIAPPFLAGRMVKFSKDGKFVFADTDEAIDPATEFVALVGETLVGWIKFHHDGETPPERVQGLLFDGFEMPLRSTLGELDQSEWPAGTFRLTGRSVEASNLFGAAADRHTRAGHLRYDEP